MQIEGQTALRRKLAGHRVGRAPIPGIEEIGENFAKLLDERARTLLRTICSAMVIDCEVRKLSRVLEQIPVPAMIGLIDVKGARDMALINIGMDLLFHIVDLRMGGDPAAAPMPIARSVTSLDAGLCEDFIKAVVEAFEAALRLNLGAQMGSAMKLSGFEQHVTMVRIAPEHSDVLVLRLSLDLGEAARTGEFDLVLPLSVLDAYRASAPVKAAAGPGKSDIWSRHMARAAADAPVRVRAVLHREQMALEALQGLAPGDVLPLPREARERVEIRIEGRPEAGPLAEGRLGAVDGRKALKLTGNPDPVVLDALRRALTAAEENE